MCLFLFCCSSSVVFAQDTTRTADTSIVVKKKIHSPLRASIYSAVIPGLGQIYNRKYWKLPIVYGGIAGFLYFAQQNRVDYLYYKQGYVNRTLALPEDALLAQYSTQGITSAMDGSRQNMEWCYIGAAAIYLLNIVDASVDAHLFNFDVSDDLSLHFVPRYIPTPLSQNNASLSVLVRF